MKVASAPQLFDFGLPGVLRLSLRGARSATAGGVFLPTHLTPSLESRDLPQSSSGGGDLVGPQEFDG